MKVIGYGLLATFVAVAIIATVLGVDLAIKNQIEENRIETSILQK